MPIKRTPRYLDADHSKIPNAVKNPKFIMEAVDLLVRAKRRKGIPAWAPIFNGLVNVAYFGAFIWLVANVWKWLT